MRHATVPVVLETSTTILLAPAETAHAVIACGPVDILATACMLTPYAATATIDVVAIYQPPPTHLANPRLTYSNGRLSRIDYDGPHMKTFVYESGRLATLDYSDGFRTLRKTFVYDASGALASIAEGFV